MRSWFIASRCVATRQRSCAVQAVLLSAQARGGLNFVNQIQMYHDMSVPAMDAPGGLGASGDTYSAAKDMYWISIRRLSHQQHPQDIPTLLAVLPKHLHAIFMHIATWLPDCAAGVRTATAAEATADAGSCSHTVETAATRTDRFRATMSAATATLHKQMHM